MPQCVLGSPCPHPPPPNAPSPILLLLLPLPGLRPPPQRKLLTSCPPNTPHPCLTEPVPAGGRWLSQHPFAHHPPAVVPAAPYKEEWRRPVQGGAQGEPVASLARVELGNHRRSECGVSITSRCGQPPPEFGVPSYPWAMYISLVPILSQCPDMTKPIGHDDTESTLRLT